MIMEIMSTSPDNNELKCCDQNQKVPGSKPTMCSTRLMDPTSYKAAGDLQAEYVKCKWLTSGEWGCLLDKGPKFAVGQPNSSLKNSSKMVAYVDNFTTEVLSKVWNTGGNHFVNLVQSLDIILKQAKHGWLLTTISVTLQIQPSKV